MSPDYSPVKDRAKEIIDRELVDYPEIELARNRFKHGRVQLIWPGRAAPHFDLDETLTNADIEQRVREMIRFLCSGCTTKDSV